MNLIKQPIISQKTSVMQINLGIRDLQKSKRPQRRWWKITHVIFGFLVRDICGKAAWTSGAFNSFLLKESILCPARLELTLIPHQFLCSFTTSALGSQRTSLTSFPQESPSHKKAAVPIRILFARENILKSSTASTYHGFPILAALFWMGWNILKRETFTINISQIMVKHLLYEWMNKWIKWNLVLEKTEI